MLGVEVLPIHRQMGHTMRPNEQLDLRVFAKPFWQPTAADLISDVASKYDVADNNVSTRAVRPVKNPQFVSDKLFLSQDTCSLRSRKESLRSCLLVPKQDGSSERVAIQKSKSVHFADSRGMSLTSVLTVFDGDEDYDSIRACFSTPNLSFPCVDAARQRSASELQRKNQLLNFVQPVALPDFQERVKENRVSLENVTFRNSCLFGTVAVQNLDFHKRVLVRYTFDAWETSQDLSAVYISCSCTGDMDTFSFEVGLPSRDTDVNVEFSICYEVLGQSYWDNNSGKNYKVACPSNVTHSTMDSNKRFLLDLAQNKMCNWIL